MNKRKMMLWLVFLGALLCGPAWPWNPAELPPGIVVETPGSPVELAGETLFFLRVKLKTLSTEQRAQAVSEQIKKLAQDPFLPQNHHRAGLGVELRYHGGRQDDPPRLGV